MSQPRPGVRAWSGASPSLIDGIRRGEGSPDLIVVDDSAREEHRAANRGLLESLRDLYPAGSSTPGRGRRSGSPGRLAAYAGLNGDDVTFGLTNPEGSPIATGASRNLLLLPRPARCCCNWTTTPSAVWRWHRVPGRASSTRRTTTPRSSGSLRAGSRRPPVPFAPHDLLAVHEQLLGKGLGDCLGSTARGRRAGFRPGRLELLPSVGRPRRGHGGRRRG